MVYTINLVVMSIAQVEFKYIESGLLSVVKPKPGKDKRTNQPELEANTYRRRQARENACRQVTISFGFTSD